MKVDWRTATSSGRHHAAVALFILVLVLVLVLEFVFVCVVVCVLTGCLHLSPTGHHVQGIGAARPPLSNWRAHLFCISMHSQSQSPRYSSLFSIRVTLPAAAHGLT
ncbi:hypothetical protein EJ05DRAFT_387996 [Pseudovirgaria hyperparasitica]|uniref:Uncharacterized protein n=1 Tax=Pseudovirgaria hyperparasitica TaxID=470096 RepID=A0A6A6W482_9PEZI|nr:uncharacterized protein EJ05DRAFT_387996 [Pseudovirgaria hyperparasitica]KAF2757365.1 hypothetical protein EJ05DRAFT_387996 [Pseudovirgaria hyperparasitica]